MYSCQDITSKQIEESFINDEDTPMIPSRRKYRESKDYINYLKSWMHLQQRKVIAPPIYRPTYKSILLKSS